MTEKLNNTRLIPYLVTAFIVSAEIAISFNSVLLPNLKADFAISNQLAQMTLAGGLFALGFSGIIYGGISDILGRRPMFLFSTTLFCISTLICAWAPTVEIFLFSRFCQGLGSGAGWVVGNACLKDLFDGQPYIKVMNYVHAVAGITPAITPVVGSYLAAQAGWRNCFYLLFIFSLASSLFMFFFHTETLKERKKFDLAQIFQQYKTLFRNSQFLTFCSVKVLAVTTLFAEISNLPLIFVNHLGVPAQNYGLYVLPPFTCYVAATIMGSRLTERIPISRVIEIGFLAILLSDLLTLFASYNFSLSALELQATRCLSYVGWGLIFGNATSLIVSAAPGLSGMASASMIALEMLFSGLGIWVLGFFFNGTANPLSTFAGAIAAIALIILRYPK